MRERMRGWIQDGTYPPGSRLPSEGELPRLMGVGKNTVVRVLNDLAREGLIVRRHGSGSYVASPTQQPLLPGRFLRLGILVGHEVEHVVRTRTHEFEMAAGALEAWGMPADVPALTAPRGAEATHGAWVSEVRGCRVDLLGEAQPTRLRYPPLSSVSSRRFDGLLAIGIVDEEWVGKLLQLGVPTVLVDYPNERLSARSDQVFFDPLPAYRQTVRALAGRGLRRIHFIGSWQHVPYADGRQAKGEEYYSPSRARPDPDTFLRKAAWRQGMDEVGLDCPNEWSHYGWQEAGRIKPLAEQLAALPANERPEAVVCHGILQAEVAVQTFAARGLPLIGVGATGGQHRHIAWPIFADNGQLGRIAGEMLLRRVKKPDAAFLRVGMQMVLPDFAGARKAPTGI
jgi:DNA-binding LacI/PurR family transcriptional regulator